MGFLDFLRGEKKPEIKDTAPEEAVSLETSQIQNWFQKSLIKEIEESKSNGRERYQDVVDSFSGIKDSLGLLESAKFNGRERIHTSANMIKDAYVKKAYVIIGNIERASRDVDISYSGLDNFHSESLKTLNDLKKTTPKQAVLMSRYFKKESAQITLKVKETENRISTLKSWLGDEATLKLVEDVNKRVREQASDSEQTKALDKRTDEIKKEIKELKEKKQGKETEFLELLKSKKWNEYNTFSDEIKNVKNEIVEIENEITNELSPMKRPLKKLEHTLRQEDLLFNHKGFVKSFIQDPFGAVKTKNGEDSFKRFVFKLNKMVHDNKIDLKDKEKEKLEILLQKMETTIPELKKRYNELMEKKEKMEKTISESTEIVKNKEELESQIKSYSEQITELEEEAKNTLKEQEKLKERIEKDNREFEKLIFKETGREIEIAG